jgi:hypothetical protein
MATGPSAFTIVTEMTAIRCVSFFMAYAEISGLAYRVPIIEAGGRSH